MAFFNSMLCIPPFSSQHSSNEWFDLDISRALFCPKWKKRVPEVTRLNFFPRLIRRREIPELPKLRDFSDLVAFIGGPNKALRKSLSLPQLLFLLDEEAGQGGRILKTGLWPTVCLFCEKNMSQNAASKRLILRPLFISQAEDRWKVWSPASDQLYDGRECMGPGRGYLVY